MIRRRCFDGATGAENVLILSCTDKTGGGGIWHCTLSGEGILRRTGYMPCQKPMYAVKSGERLHILLRAPFPDGENSGYFSCMPDFSDPTQIRDTLGKCACHLAVDDGDVYIANYLSGSLVKNFREISVHTGSGVNLPRQDMPHTHFACFSPDRQYVLCCDLGLDTVFIYDRQLREISRARVPDGYGVRHLVFAQDGRHFYSVNELVPSVSTFSYEAGQATYIDTVTMPCDVSGATAAAIRCDETENKLYISVRGEDKIFIFALHDGRPVPFANAPCGGRGPRDFQIFGDNIVCTNENSGSVTVIDKHTLQILDNMTFTAPLCVLKA